MFFDLEKWLTILKDLEEYPKNLNINIETILITIGIFSFGLR